MGSIVPGTGRALIGCSLMAGVGAVAYTASVPAGASLAVWGCGGIGLNAIQGGAIVGANPIIAVDTVDSKLEYAREMGATHTFNARQPDRIEAMKKATGGRGVESVDPIRFIGNECKLIGSRYSARAAS